MDAEEIDPLADPDEKRVLYAALDSFRYGSCFVLVMPTNDLI